MDDVREHRLVPEHTILKDGADQERIDAVLDEYDISRTDLPKITRTDPAIKGLDAAAGDVVKITRDSRTADEATVYRLVVEP